MPPVLRTHALAAKTTSGDAEYYLPNVLYSSLTRLNGNARYAPVDYRQAITDSAMPPKCLPDLEHLLQVLHHAPEVDLGVVRHRLRGS
eukprot:7443587-Pyramimonas_sp.AAC.1